MAKKNKNKKFSIDARLILQLGRDSIKDHSTALIELVKNSYDADATKVEIEIYEKKDGGYIRIADNGFGMTEEQINQGWLRIGFSDKIISKESESGRRKTGEKGIGRIATDRLGAITQIITKAAEDSIQSLEVNWDDFDKPGIDITAVEIKPLDNPKINIPQKPNVVSTTGTEVIIKKQRQNWSKSTIENLYEELSVFTPPYSGIEDFEITIKTDLDVDIPEKIQSAYYKTAEIEIDAHYDGDSEQVIYTIRDKYSPEEETTEVIDVSKLFSTHEKTGKSRLECGPFDLKLMFFPRVASLLNGTSFTLSDLREFLDKNAGVKIYRDNISVKPYGYVGSQFGEDWLGLAERKAKDPAGISRETYKITPNQLVGALFIGRDKNPKLKDSAAREGLVENEAFKDLKHIMLSSVVLLESYRYKLHKKINKKKPKKEKSAEDNVKKITNDLGAVKENLESIKSSITDFENNQSIVKSIQQVEHAIEQTEKTFEELLDEKRVLSGLATLGISSAVFGHETQNAITTFKDASTNAERSLTKTTPNIKRAKNELEKALKYAKLISGWGAFALSRVSNEKRRKIGKRLRQLIRDTINEIKPAFDASNIELEFKLEHINAKVFPMDLESIILNLMTNAYNAAMHGEKERKIKIELIRENYNDVKGFQIVVSDSGPGIAKEHIDRIWNPLFSTKVGSSKKTGGGTGLGLTIVKSIVEEQLGYVEASHDDELKGARFLIWLPKE